MSVRRQSSIALHIIQQSSTHRLIPKEIDSGLLCILPPVIEKQLTVWP